MTYETLVQIDSKRGYLNFVYKNIGCVHNNLAVLKIRVAVGRIIEKKKWLLHHLRLGGFSNRNRFLIKSYLSYSIF